MAAIPGYALNSVLTPSTAGTAGSLVGAADVRQYGQLDTPYAGGSPTTLSFIDVLKQANPQ